MKHPTRHGQDNVTSVAPSAKSTGLAGSQPKPADGVTKTEKTPEVRRTYAKPVGSTAALFSGW